jgi:signal transduction histidine kinase
MIFLVLFNYILIHIIYLLYNLGENIIKDNNKYKKIKQDNRLKTSLFKITHEIKNPIAVIKAYLDMLNTKDRKQVEKYIPIIKSEIDRLLNVLQDFLLVNKANVTFDLMDINMLIEDIISREITLMEANNIKFKSDLIDDEIYINGDYNRLSQVLINIIKNSIEAMENRKGVITIKDIIKDNNINIIVIDEGIGISKKIMAKIKEPFYTTKNRGTGLGVSLSDEIIKAHNGTLSYDSKEGVGTKVTIKLPLYGKDEI